MDKEQRTNLKNKGFYKEYFWIRDFIKKVRTDFWKLLESLTTKELRKSK